MEEIREERGEKEYLRYDIEGRVREDREGGGKEVEYWYKFYERLSEKVERKSGVGESYKYYGDGSIKCGIGEGMEYR